MINRYFYKVLVIILVVIVLGLIFELIRVDKELSEIGYQAQYLRESNVMIQDNQARLANNLILLLSRVCRLDGKVNNCVF